MTACVTYSASAANIAEVDRGITWLNGQVTASGTLQSEASSIASPQQARVETYLTLKSLASPTTALADTVIADTDANTEYLARKILVQAAAARDASTLITQIRALQNTDGGFGVYSGFTSNALDTAWALQALKSTNAPATDAAVTSALAYLQSVQGTDGSFTVFDQSSIYVTSVVITALGNWASSSNVTSTVQAATNYLLAQRAADGSWGNSVFLTSHVFTSIRNFQPQEPLATSIKTYLTARQAVDGSWANGDPYATALALRALSLTGSTPGSPLTGAVRGQTKDSQTSLPLSGVVVALSGQGNLSTTTGGDGRFQFVGLIPGGYAIQMSIPEYSTINSTFVLTASQTIDFGVVNFTKLAGGTNGTVRGVVTDAVTGAALQNARVAILGQSLTAFTDASGSYQITLAVPGILEIVVTANGYSAVQRSGAVTAGNVLIFSPSMQPNGGVALAGASITGLINAAANNLPLAGVTVSVSGASSQSTTTDAQGNFLLSGLNGGAATLTASKAGFDTVNALATLATGTVTPFSPKLYPAGTSPANANTAGISGVVLDAGSNAPLAGATIVGTYNNTSATVMTGSDGRFTFNGIVSGAASLALSLPNYVGSTVTLALPPLNVLDIGQIRLRKVNASTALPDLTVRAVSRTAAITDVQTLALSGSVLATIVNAGAGNVNADFQLLAFYDVNHDGSFTPGIDIVLGKTTLSGGLVSRATSDVAINVQGHLPFRDAPIHVWVDSAQSIIESSKANNVFSTGLSAEAPVPPGPFLPVLKWQWAGGASIATPLVGPLTDTNGDGKFDQNDIPTVVVNEAFGIDGGNGLLRALSGTDGRVIWAVTDPALYTDSEATPAIGDIDGDGKPDVVMMLHNGGVAVLNNDGTLKWKSTIPPRPGPYLGGGITLADLDGDGKSEILIRNYVLNSDGTLRFQFNPSFDQYSGHIVSPIVADLDLDGSPEIIVGNTAVHADGTLYWQNTNLPQSSQMAVANFDGSAFPQIVMYYFGSLYLINHDGTIKWGPVPTGVGGGGGGVIVGDFDGDGVLDIGVFGASYVGAFNADGSLKWRSPISGGSGSAGLTAFDFEGFGKMKLIETDNGFFRIHDGTTGDVLFSVPNGTATARDPVVVDVDGDGHADILVMQQSGGNPGLRVYQNQNNSWVRTGKIWNQYNAHLTNINQNGTLPRQERNSWLVNNTYRVNGKIDESITAVRDLSASFVRVVDNGGTASSTLTVRVGNAGGYSVPSGVKVAYFNGNPTTGGTLLGIKTTAVVLNTGEYEDVSLSIAGSLASIGTLYVVADNDGAGATAVADFDRTNNTVSYVMTAQATSFAAQVSTDKVAYGANANVGINVNLSNVGSFAGSINIRGSIQTADGVRLATLSGTGPVSLASQASSVIPLTWNTTNTLIGDYFAVIELLDADSRVVNTARAMFIIVTDPPQPLASVVYSDKSSYQFGETARITGRVTNLSVNTLFDAHSLRTKVSGPSGTEVFAATRNLPQLTPGAITDSVLNMSLAAAAPGSYIVEQQLINGAGTTVQTKTARFDVRSTADTGAGLRAILAISPWRVNVGNVAGLAATVTNAGNAAVTALPATIRIIDPRLGVVVQRIDTVLSIGILQQQLWNTTWTPAATMPVGTYVVALSIQPPSGEKVLAQGLIQIGAVKPFVLAPVIDVALSSLQTSTAALINGIVVPDTIQITGGEYSLNGGAFTSQVGQVQAGDSVVLRQTASPLFSTKTTTTITIGAFSTGFDVTTVAADTTPDAFTFTPVVSVNQGTVVLSNTVTITGINTTVAVTITGGQYSVNGGAFTGVAGTLKNGDTLTLQEAASAQFTTTTTATVTVGTVSADFNVTTLAARTTPDPFSFVALTNTSISAVVRSNTVTISGINTTVPVTIVGGEFSINGAPFTSAPGMLRNGDTLALKVTASPNFSTKTTATVTVGTVSSSFDVTTLAAITTPNPFSFSAQTAVAIGVVTTSNTVTITGINTTVPVTIVGGQYSLNGGAYTTAAGTLKSGDTLTLRQTSSTSNGTKTTATVTVGASSATFDVTTTTAVTIPNPFTFTAQSGVAINALVTSNTVTISGITVGVPISIVGGTYRINNGAFTNAAGTVNPNDTVTVRLTAGATYNTTTSAIVTVSTISTGFVVTTLTVEPPVVTPALARDARVLVLVNCGDGTDDGEQTGDHQGQNTDNATSCTGQRKSFLDSYLSANGIAHKIVSTASDFQTELRCGRYNVYWLAGSGAKLSGTFAAELSEAVFRGDSLIVDGHLVSDEDQKENNNGFLSEVLGVKLKDEQDNASVVLSGSFLPAGSFNPVGKLQRVQLTTGVTQATFTGEKGGPAVVTNVYGMGRGLLYAFDLVATLQGNPTTPLLKAVLTQSVAEIAPQVPASITGGGFVALKTTLRNPAVVSQVIELAAILPPGTSLVNAMPAATSSANGIPVWQLTLAAGQTVTVNALLTAPFASGTYTVSLPITRIEGSVRTPLGTASVALTVRAADATAVQTVSNLQALSPTGNEERQARDRALAALQDAITKTNANQVASAVPQYLKAADELDKVTSVPVTANQLAIDRLLQEAGRKWCSQLPLCTAAAPASAPTGLFTPFGVNEGLLVKGGRSGTFDGTWALGGQGEDGDHLATANLDWVSGKLYNWSLTYDGTGNGSYTVKDGTALLFTKSYKKDDSHALRTGNAISFTANAVAGLADARLETVITSLNNTPLSATVGTPGNNLAASSATAYFYPGLTTGMNVTGTIKLSFTGAVPTGSKLGFLVNAGSMSCYTP